MVVTIVHILNFSILIVMMLGIDKMCKPDPPGKEAE